MLLSLRIIWRCEPLWISPIAFAQCEIQNPRLCWGEAVKPARRWILITLRDDIWDIQWFERQAKTPLLVLVHSAPHALWAGLQLPGGQTIVAGVGIANEENPGRREIGAILCHTTFGQRRRGRPSNWQVQGQPPTGRTAQDFNRRRPPHACKF